MTMDKEGTPYGALNWNTSPAERRDAIVSHFGKLGKAAAMNTLCRAAI